MPSSLKTMVRLLVHSSDLWPRPPQVKHSKELILTVSSVGVDDEEALDLKLLVGGWLVVDEAFLELDLPPVLGNSLVEVGVAEVVGA